MFFSSGQKQVWMKNRVRKRKKSGKKRKGRKQISNKRQLAITILFLAVFISILHSSFLWKPNSVSGISPKQEEGSVLEAVYFPRRMALVADQRLQKIFSKNPYSRSGIALRKVKGVVIHYVENPGSTAKENRDYFNNLQNTHLTKASSHYIVGLDGEVIQCIPQSEISYASNNRNKDTISIECCHPKKNGKFNDKTYNSAVRLTAWICKTYGLSSKNVIRHYDVTGKMCPRYYVKHEQAWKDFCNKVQECLEKD